MASSSPAIPTVALLATLVLLSAVGSARAQGLAASQDPVEDAGPLRSVTAQSAASLPDSIPVFPLPDIALLPGARMPLHIFEPRYREMVADALEGDRIIGMVMLEPGFEEDYEGNPPVHEVGGAGVIESADRLSDGRYNIVLEGVSKFRILGENTGRSYRVARVEPVPEALTDEERVRLSRERSRLEEAVREVAPSVRVPETLSDEVWVNTVIQYLPIPSAQRQELLEAEDALARARRLLEILGATRQAGR